MNTFKAAYVPDDGSGTGGGVLLTTADDAGLPDDELLELGQKLADEMGVQGEIVIGDWRE